MIQMFAVRVAVLALNVVLLPTALYAVEEAVSEKAELAAEVAQLREQVAKLKEHVAKLETKLVGDSRRRIKPRDRRYAFDGCCPVTLEQQGVWRVGRVEHQVEHEGMVYLFVGADEKRFFEQDPGKYGAAFSGVDVVSWVDRQERASGDRRHGVWYRNRILLFASEGNLAQFSTAPAKYVEAAAATPPAVEIADAGGETDDEVVTDEPALLDKEASEKSTAPTRGRRGKTRIGRRVRSVGRRR